MRVAHYVLAVFAVCAAVYGFLILVVSGIYYNPLAALAGFVLSILLIVAAFIMDYASPPFPNIVRTLLVLTSFSLLLSGMLFFAIVSILIMVYLRYKNTDCSPATI